MSGNAVSAAMASNAGKRNTHSALRSAPCTNLTNVDGRASCLLGLCVNWLEFSRGIFQQLGWVAALDCLRHRHAENVTKLVDRNDVGDEWDEALDRLERHIDPFLRHAVGLGKLGAFPCGHPAHRPPAVD